MAPTLRRVTAMASLRLRVLAAGEALDRPVRWVAVSELEDPTPFLEGAELVLTTGMRLGPDDAVPYMSRLVRRGVAGLGFGVGLSHDVVPESFVAAAAAAGMPLLEVHRDTPFIAVGKAVSELLAAEQYEEISRAFAAQGRLTRAALQPAGPNTVIDRLAREIGGWAILLDGTGAVRWAAGDVLDAGEVADKARRLAPELARLRTPAHTSLALATPEENVIVQPLGRRGFFAVGRRQPFSPIAHTIVNAAGSLLTLALEQGRGQRGAARRVRAAALRLLVAGESRSAREVLTAIGADLPDGPALVLMCAADDPDALAETLPCFTAPWGTAMAAIAPLEESDHLISRAAAYGRVGVSNPATVTTVDLARALEQAECALVRAAPVARFADLAGQGMLSLLDQAAAAAFADALLAPLREHGARGDMIESLRAYLACNGHWDAAAHRLGVHRHTLRYRMKRVSELIGKDLDDPAARAELWIALSL